MLQLPFRGGSRLPHAPGLARARSIAFVPIVLSIIFSTVLCAAAFGAGAPGAYESAHASAAVNASRPERLRLAIVNSYGKSIMDDYYSRTIRAVKEKLAPVEIDVRIYGPDGFLKAAEEGKFDMSIASSGLTSLMIERTGGLPLAAVVSDEAPDPNYANGAAIIVRADRTDLRTLEDLQGKSLAIMSRTAFAGWQIPAAELVRKGFDPESFFSEIRITEFPMTRIVKAVRDGGVDVGFVATCLLERMERNGEIDPDAFRVIGEHADRIVACRHSTELYPNWFFSIKPSIPTRIAKTLTATLLAIPPADDGTQWTISNDNRRLYEVFRILQVPYGSPDDFSRFVKRMLPWVVGAGGVLLILLLNTLLLARIASRRARALEKAMDEKLRAELVAQQNALQVESLTRASAVGLLSSMVAHELKQPLTVIGNYAGSLRRRLSRGDVPRETLLASVTEIEDSGTRAAAIIDRVRSYGQVRQRSMATVNLSELVETAAARWRRHASHRIPCTLDIAPGLMVEADRLEIELAVLNIVKNAAAAVKEVPDAEINVTLAVDGAYAKLTIADNGPALTDEEISRLGDIGYTTTAGGLGLGIAIVHSLLEAHGGSISYRRRTDLGGRGLACTVRLPLAAAENA